MWKVLARIGPRCRFIYEEVPYLGLYFGVKHAFPSVSRTGVSMHSGTPTTVQTLYIRRGSKLRRKERRELRGNITDSARPAR